MVKKTCKKCSHPKEINEKNFYRRFRNQDGWDGTCIECRRLAGMLRVKPRNSWMNLFMGN